jgi:hypothetical protein
VVLDLHEELQEQINRGSGVERVCCIFLFTI